MIYDNYFQIPDGSMCRPRSGMEIYFYPKEDWIRKTVPKWSGYLFSDALGQWETLEKTITITEQDFDAAVNKHGGDSRGCPENIQWALNVIKRELFK